MPNLPHPDFVCPECHGPVLDAAASSTAIAPATLTLACAACGRVWPVVDGLPDFTCEDIYWGEFERPAAERLVAAARAEGWRAAAESVLAARPELIEYILNERRANALSLVPFGRRGRLLDIGAGWGAITTAASRLFDRVYSIEAVRLRAQFTRLRLAGEGRANVVLAQASLFALPFPENFFDVILLNGILEWIGDWDRSLPPRAAQRALLRRLSAHLRPGGLLLIGIENRIGYRYFLGRRDHNGLWGTNLLPRPLASAVQRLRQGAPYRVYTYAMPGLRRLLRDGGFAGPQFFAPMPGYNIPNSIVPLEGRGRLAFQLTRRVSRHTLKRRLAARAAVWLEHLGVLRHIPADFLIAAHRPGGGAASEPGAADTTTLWDDVRGALAERLPEELRRARARDVIVHGEHNPGRPVMIVLDNAGQSAIAYVKAVTPDLAPMLRAERDVLVRLAAAARPADASASARLFPCAYGFMETPRGAALALEALDGVPLYHEMKQPGSGRAAGERFLRPALELALTLAERVGMGKDNERDSGDLRHLHERLLHEWREAVSEAASALPAGASKRFATLITSVTTARFQHGDFFSKNILWNERKEEGRGNKVIAPALRLVDWADAGWHLPPLFDVVLYLATCWTELGDVVPAEARAAHTREAFRGGGALNSAWREAWARGKTLWNLSDDWTPEDAALLALAVYRRRLAAIKGAAHPEVAGVEACLRDMAS